MRAFMRALFSKCDGVRELTDTERKWFAQLEVLEAITGLTLWTLLGPVLHGTMQTQHERSTHFHDFKGKLDGIIVAQYNRAHADKVVANIKQSATFVDPELTLPEEIRQRLAECELRATTANIVPKLLEAVLGVKVRVRKQRGHGNCFVEMKRTDLFIAASMALAAMIHTVPGDSLYNKFSGPVWRDETMRAQITKKIGLHEVVDFDWSTRIFEVQCEIEKWATKRVHGVRFGEGMGGWYVAVAAPSTPSTRIVRERMSEGRSPVFAFEGTSATFDIPGADKFEYAFEHVVTRPIVSFFDAKNFSWSKWRPESWAKKSAVEAEIAKLGSSRTRNINSGAVKLPQGVSKAGWGLAPPPPT
jgi:hypothetical protein